MDIHELSDAINKLGKIDLSKFTPPEPTLPVFDISAIEPIDPEETIMGDIKRKIQEQNKLVAQQIEVLDEQNKLLASNYNKLKEMFDMQTTSYRDAQEDLRKSRSFNRWMMVIAVVAMLAAIAGPIATIIVSR